MSQSKHEVGGLAVTDEDVVEWCEQHLPKPFDLDKLYDILDDKSNATDEEVYYSYFLYCWTFLTKTYLASGYNQFRSLPCTQEMMKLHELVLDRQLLNKTPEVFLFYIVLASQEVLIRNPLITIIGDAVKLLPFIGKIQHMMSRIDSISRKNNQTQMILGFIPYIISSYQMRDVVKQTKVNVSDAQKLLNEIVNDPQWSNIKSFLSDSETLTGKINDQSALINQIKEYDNKLNELKSEYNFVSLSKAFNNIRKIKTNELRNVNKFFYSTIVMLLMTPLALLLFNIFGDLTKFQDWNKLLYLLPIATIELIILYLLRLFYSQKNSIMAQLLQIDFRLSICEFIKNYVADRTENKEEKETWNAFESLIFSPLQLREDKIPSVLDSADSIAEFINKAISAKNTTTGK